MRSTTVVGAALIVIIIVALLAFSFRGASTDTQEAPQAVSSDIPLSSGGQFFQEVPSTVVGEEGPTASVSPEATPVTISEEVVSTGKINITVSETGFAPAEVTIVPGTTVTFVNNGQAAHWPASDVHPTHDVLPDFDSKRGLATGETYSYTFTKTGTWACHDHLMPQHECVITVASGA